MERWTISGAAKAAENARRGFASALPAEAGVELRLDGVALDLLPRAEIARRSRVRITHRPTLLRQGRQVLSGGCEEAPARHVRWLLRATRSD